MTQLPIEDYALIGDMHTAALVGKNGSIDWMCLPHFDSPSVFGALVDADQGGFFQIAPDPDDVTPKQQYWPDTNVLMTRFLAAHGAAELVDFMPVGDAQRDVTQHELVRRLRVVRGEVRFRMRCRPAFDYALSSHETTLVDGGVRFDAPSLSVGLATGTPLEREGDGVTSAFTLREGEEAVFCLRLLDSRSGCGHCTSTGEAEALFRATVQYWHDWLSQCTYQGRWREMVRRSALVLKLMTYEPTGATIAAPTTSLPEFIGGPRNWDYRYSWIRDSAFTLYALLRLGFTQEAGRYIGFLQTACKRPGRSGPLQLMYGIDGRPELDEKVLDHLSGYRGSRPVRVGNGAHEQLQLDIYGELIDAVYLYDKYGTPITYETWLTVRRCADWVAENWHLKDEGIWEVRAGRRHFVYSKLMCWVALDRALRIAQHGSLPGPIDRWREVRDRIFEEIMERGFDRERQAFVQSYDSPYLDAAVLMLPLALFISPVDPLMLSTLDALMQPRGRGGLLSNHLVYRYDLDRSADGLGGDEGTFNICTFWLVEALTRAGRHDPRYLARARLVFENMLGLASSTGLYAEETGPRGEALGNYPQAFTHLSLISAAVNLDRALGEGT